MSKQKKLFILLATLLVSLSVQAQQMHLNWMKRAGGVDWDMVTGMTMANHKIYVTGSFYDAIHFESDTLTSYGNRDIYVARYDEAGRFFDAFGMGSQGFDHCFKTLVNDENSIIVACKTNLDFTIGDAVIKRQNNINLIIAWLTPEGKLIQKIVLASAEKASIADMVMAPDGNLYFAGNFTGELTGEDGIRLVASDNDIFIGKVNKNGKLQWIKHWKGVGEDRVFNLQKDDKGKLVITGATSSGCFEEKEIAKPSPLDREKFLFVATMNDAGNILSASYPWHGYDFITNSIAVTKDEIWISASFKYFVTTDKEKIQSKGKSDILLLSSPLNKVNFETLQFGGPGNDLPIQIVESGKHLVLAGTYTDSILIGSNELIPSDFNKEILLFTLNEKRKVDKVFNFDGAYGKFSNSLLTNSSGIYLAGEFGNTMESDQIKVNSAGNEDIFIARFENCDAKNPLTINIDTIRNGKNVSFDLIASEGFISYVWSDNSKKQFTKTNKTGVYYVEVEDQMGCFYIDSASITTYKSLIFSDSAIVSEQIKVYPTITRDWVYLVSNTEIESNGFSIEGIDMNGKIVFENKYSGSVMPGRIYRAGFNTCIPGQYLLRLRSEQGVKTSKIMVKTLP